MNTIMKILLGLAIIALAIVALIIVPFAPVYALNTYIDLGVPYDFSTWTAGFALMLYFKNTPNTTSRR